MLFFSLHERVFHFSERVSFVLIYVSLYSKERVSANRNTLFATKSVLSDGIKKACANVLRKPF